MESNGIVVIDLETTGFSPLRGDRIIEIAAVEVTDGCITSEFQSLVSVPKKIPAQATRIHGITNQMLSGQPGADEVFTAFRRFLGARDLVAHNARFDMTFLAHEMGRLGMFLSNSHFCTLQLSRRYLPSLPNHRLETVYRHLYGKLPEGVRQHRALGDARLTAAVWLALADG